MQGKMHTLVEPKLTSLGDLAIEKDWGMVPRFVTYFDARFGFSNRHVQKAKLWCEANCIYGWILRHDDTFYFEHDSDAAIFWLVHGEPDVRPHSKMDAGFFYAPYIPSMQLPIMP